MRKRLPERDGGAERAGPARATGRPATGADRVLELQRLAGNHATADLLAVQRYTETLHPLPRTRPTIVPLFVVTNSAYDDLAPVRARRARAPVAFAATVPTTASGKNRTPSSLETLYRTEGAVESGAPAVLVVGLNRKDPGDAAAREELRSELLRHARAVERDGALPTVVVGFLWNADGGVPFGEIRDHLKNADITRRVIGKLQARADAVYLHVGDPDALSLGRQRGDAPLFERATGVLKDANPLVAGGGFGFQRGSDVARGEANPNFAHAAELSSNIAFETSQVDPMVPYYSEASLFINARDKDAMAASFGKGKDESKQYLQSLAGLVGGSPAILFDPALGVTTHAERLTEKLKPARDDSVKETLRDVRNKLPQSLVRPLLFHRRLVSAQSLSKPEQQLTTQARRVFFPPALAQDRQPGAHLADAERAHFLHDFKQMLLVVVEEAYGSRYAKERAKRGHALDEKALARIGVDACAAAVAAVRKKAGKDFAEVAGPLAPILEEVMGLVTRAYALLNAGKSTPEAVASMISVVESAGFAHEEATRHVVMGYGPEVRAFVDEGQRILLAVASDTTGQKDRGKELHDHLRAYSGRVRDAAVRPRVPSVATVRLDPDGALYAFADALHEAIGEPDALDTPRPAPRGMEAHLTEILREHGRRPVPVAGDGLCLLRAVAAARGLTLQQVVDRLRTFLQSPARINAVHAAVPRYVDLAPFSAWWSRPVATIRQDLQNGGWVHAAYEAAPEMLARALGVPITIVQTVGPGSAAALQQVGPGGAHPIYVAHTGGNHYWGTAALPPAQQEEEEAQEPPRKRRRKETR